MIIDRLRCAIVENIVRVGDVFVLVELDIDASASPSIGIERFFINCVNSFADMFHQFYFG